MPSRSAQSTRRIVVALDGPASSGKSSVGAAAAEQLQLRFVDTGLFYRALTALALLEGVELDDPAVLVPLVDRVSLGDDGSGRFTRVLLDGSDATEEARSALVDGSVSTVARVPEVRAALLERQRELAADGGIVMAGRDVGTVVLPDADLKLFLDASVEERARRRIDERGLDPDGAEAEEVREQLRARDAIDTGREVAPLRAADDAVHVLTDGNAFDETVEIVAAEIAGVMLTPRPRTRTGSRHAAPSRRRGGWPMAPSELESPRSPKRPAEAAAPKPTRTRTRKVAAAAVVADEPKPKRVRKPKVAARAGGGVPRPDRAGTRRDTSDRSADDRRPRPRRSSRPRRLRSNRRPSRNCRTRRRSGADPDEARAKPALDRPRARPRSHRPRSESRRLVGDADVEPPWLDLPGRGIDQTSVRTRPSRTRPASTRRSRRDGTGPYATSAGRGGHVRRREVVPRGRRGDAVGGRAATGSTRRHADRRLGLEGDRSASRARVRGRPTEAPDRRPRSGPTTGEAQQRRPPTRPTRRSEARARATARRAALVAAAAVGGGRRPRGRNRTRRPVPEPARREGRRITPTRRAQARSRATARRAAIAATAASDESESATRVEPSPSSRQRSRPRTDPAIPGARQGNGTEGRTRRCGGHSARSGTGSEPEPATPAHTPTKRSQARARATARRAALAAATSDAEARRRPAEPLPEPARSRSPSGSESEPGLPRAGSDRSPRRAAARARTRTAIAAATAAAAAAAPRAPRPAAKPKERDPILEAAMQPRQRPVDARPDDRARGAHRGAAGRGRRRHRASTTSRAAAPVILAVNHISNADPVVVGRLDHRRAQAAADPLAGQARAVRVAGPRLGGGPRRHPPRRPRRRGRRGVPARDEDPRERATSCSCSPRAPAAPRASSRRRRTASRCSPCAPARRSSRSA